MVIQRRLKTGCVPAQPLYRFDGRLRIGLGVIVLNGDRITAPGKLHGDRPADANSATGYKRKLHCQPTCAFRATLS